MCDKSDCENIMIITKWTHLVDLVIMATSLSNSLIQFAVEPVKTLVGVTNRLNDA